MKPDHDDKGTALMDAQRASPRPRTLRGYLMLGLAFLTCPCHLPILLVVLAGTAAGAYLRDNLFLSGIAVTAAFLTSLLLGLRWIGPTASGDRK